MSWRERARSRADPLFRFSWDIAISSPGGAIDSAYVEEINVPLPKYDSDSAVFKARKYYFAKFEDFGVASVKFYEDEKGTVMSWLRTWQNKMKTENGDYEVPSKYKGTITVPIKDAKNATTKTLTLYGVFPTQLPSLPLGSTGEIIQLDVEFSVDRVELK